MTKFEDTPTGPEPPENRDPAATESQGPDARGDEPKHPSDTTPRGNPPTDHDEVERGREKMDRIVSS